MKIKESKYLYIISFPIIFTVFFLMSIFVEHTTGIHGRGDLLCPGPLTWEEIFKNIKHYIFVNLILTSFVYFVAFYPFKKNKGGKNGGKYSKALNRIMNREKYTSLPNKYECRICGYKNDDFPWGVDGKSPSFQICPCCGVQFGVNDITPEDMQKYFEQWKNTNYKWNNTKFKPADWVMEEQIKNKWMPVLPDIPNK